MKYVVGVSDGYDPIIQQMLSIGLLVSLMGHGTGSVILVEGLHVCGCVWRW